MKQYNVPSRVRDITDLERMADRVHAGGVAQSIAAQLEMDKDIDIDMAKEALDKCVTQIYKLLEQSFCLEQKLEAAYVSLGAEKRMCLDLRVENKLLVQENAELQKTNRTLKRELQNLMSNGG